MEECTEESVQEKKQGEEAGTEQEGDESERGRPSTPKWWRPPIPPETYQWEEVRRQRQKGGYPWTHLDKDEEIDADDYLDDNLYEPVNPPPLYGNDSYLSKDLQQVPQMEDKMIEIPPEVEILTSEGLDGLDKPDPHDLGFDGDREWQNASEDEGHQSRSSFTAGIRKPGESRSTTPKSVGFSPDTILHETPVDDDFEEQEVPGDMQADAEPTPSSSIRGRRSRSSSPGGRKQTAFDILKSKAADAADQMKQRIKSAIPVRPKFTKSRKRRKVKHEQGEHEAGDQEAPEDAEMKDPDAETEEQGEKPEEPPEQAGDEAKDSGEPVSKEPEASADTGETAEEDGEKSSKQQEKEEKERKKAEEKAAKQKAADEAKQAKIEEKLAKAREAEEKRQAKAEEEKRKQEEKEEAARIAAEAKKEEEAKKAAEKAAKEEEARIAAEAKKAEEEARKAAEKAKKEEEARKRAEAKKAEEERKAAEKAKRDEEARIAAEAKKAEEERKAAEKRAKAEAARKAAAERKAAEEEARKLEEARKAEEEAARKAEEPEVIEDKPIEESVNEEAQPMDTTEEGADGEGNEEDMEAMQPQTPSGTTKRKYIRHRKGTPTQLSQLPNPIASLRNQVEDFKNKLKRSRTPPRRPIQRKHRRSRSADASKSPPRDPDDISNRGDEEQEQGEAKAGDEGEAQESKQSDQEPTSAEKVVVVQSEAKAEETPEKSTEALQQSSPAAEEESERPEEEPAPAPTGTSTGTVERRRLRHPPAKEKLDKIGQQISRVGAGVLGVASQATNAVGNTINTVCKMGAKTLVDLIPEKKTSKSKTDIAQEEAVAAPPPVEEPEPTPPAPEAVPPKRTFRFRRRNESQEEGDEEIEQEGDEHYYENAQAEQDANARNAFLGSGARDWESPQDRANSRGVSEERFSGNVSSRDSPPGSSLASSTMAQVRRTGVLEEIDSDEFFLRERGISEGEDEEEVNRFLVEELRQAFRPSLSNALTGFDMEPPLAPPSRPKRAPRKPPRKEQKENEESSTPSMYQTFPPERPKRKQPQGYVSKFMKEHEEEDGEYLDSNEEVRGSTGDMEEELEDTDAMQLVKDKLSELDRELDDTNTAVENVDEPNTVEEYEDDGRYEPINEGPTKPTRTKRKQPKRPPTPPTFYYNTIAGNEWLRELEEHTQGSEPAPPIRKRRGSGKSSSLPPGSDDGRDFRGENIPTYSEPNQSAAASVQESGNEDNADYVDEAGYAIVQKDRDLPKTIPRKKKKRTNLSGQTGAQPTLDPSGAFFSLPRGSGSSNETPPTRPNRTYSTLRPRRPPRSKSGSRQNLESSSPVPGRREGEEPRPSTAIGIMQGRPLPPPPRPQRSPAPFNDLDQSSIEMSVGLRHYANFEDIESRPLEEVLTSPPRVIEVDIACQTDPVPDDEFIIGLPEESQMEDSGRIRAASSQLESQDNQQEETQRDASATTAGDVSSSFQTSSPPPPPQHTQPSDSFPTNPSPTSFTFPTKLHLEQLEVDFLRVNDLCAQSIKVENLQASQLEVNSISASGPVCVSRIQTESLNSDEVNCSRLSSDTVDMPSIPPSSFFQFSSPSPAKPGSEQELCLKAEEKEDKENESACPPDLFDSVNNLMENVDSTNDLKSSHVAEKIVDKQLNLPDSSHTEDNSKPERKDASVGTSIPPTVPPTQLNNLNQTSSSQVRKSESPERREIVKEAPLERQIVSEVPLERQIVREVPLEREIIRGAPLERQVLSRVEQPQSSSASQIETPEVVDDEPEEENVVCGSYTLPYSYMSPQLPAPTTPVRTSSLKKRQRSTDSAPKTPPSPRRSDAHIAFGHTSVAQGDVLSVKLSIPVERASIGHPQNVSGVRTQPRPQQGTSSPSQLPESTSSQADSSKRDAQKKVEAERKSVSPSATAAVPPPTLSQQLPTPRAPLDTPADASEQEESFFATSARLGRAVLRFTMRALQAMADYIDTAASEDPSKAEQQRANMQVLLCLLLFLLVGLILATTRSGPYSSPRWEFLMPPPDL